VPVANVQAGDLGTGVLVKDASIALLSAAKVSGLLGSATLPAANVSSGDLGTGVLVKDDSIATLTASKVSGSLSAATLPTVGVEAGNLGSGVKASAAYSGVISYWQALAPGILGYFGYCSDCVPPKAIISTGTAAGQFADFAGGEFK